MKFCSCCSAPVVVQIPEGDRLPRHVCTDCGTIHYQNPRIVAGCIPEWRGRVLLCRRAIEPRRGFWTLPAGFMENGETTDAAAVRHVPRHRQAAAAPLVASQSADAPAAPGTRPLAASAGGQPPVAADAPPPPPPESETPANPAGIRF